MKKACTWKSPPSGGKWWRLKYRIEGKEKRISLGTYPDVGLKEAREKRDEAPKLLAAGIDPGENRKAQKAAGTGDNLNSFEVVARGRSGSCTEYLHHQVLLPFGFFLGAMALRFVGFADVAPFSSTSPAAGGGK